VLVGSLIVVGSSVVANNAPSETNCRRESSAGFTQFPQTCDLRSPAAPNDPSLVGGRLDANHHGEVRATVHTLTHVNNRGQATAENGSTVVHSDILTPLPAGQRRSATIQTRNVRYSAVTRGRVWR